MNRCKITVLKISNRADLNRIEKSCKEGCQNCPCLKEGQEFTCDIDNKSGFCNSVLSDIAQFVKSRNSTEALVSKSVSYLTNEFSSFISCCSDSLRPVIFKLEAI